MKIRKSRLVKDHTGSTFDSFLEDEGIREEVEGGGNQAGILAGSLKRQ